MLKINNLIIKNSPQLQWHLSSAQKPHVTNDYCRGKLGWDSCPYREVLLDSTGTEDALELCEMKWRAGDHHRTGEKGIREKTESTVSRDVSQELQVWFTLSQSITPSALDPWEPHLQKCRCSTHPRYRWNSENDTNHLLWLTSLKKFWYYWRELLMGPSISERTVSKMCIEIQTL